MENRAGRTPTCWPQVDPESQRDLAAFLEEWGVSGDDIAEAIRADSLWEITTESILATRDDLTLEELAARAGLTVHQLTRVLRAVGLDTDSCSTEDVIVAVAGAETFKLFRDEEAALRLLRVYGSSTRRFADAALAAYIATVEKPLVDDDATVLAHAKAQAVSIEGREGRRRRRAPVRAGRPPRPQGLRRPRRGLLAQPRVTRRARSSRS